MSYFLGAFSDERRARMSASQNRRLGNPEGYRTLYGILVPVEHHATLTHCAQLVRGRGGPEKARAFVRSVKAEGWACMPRLREASAMRKNITANQRTVRNLVMEVYRANKNRR